MIIFFLLVKHALHGRNYAKDRSGREVVDGCRVLGQGPLGLLSPLKNFQHFTFYFQLLLLFLCSKSNPMSFAKIGHNE